MSDEPTPTEEVIEDTAAPEAPTAEAKAAVTTEGEERSAWKARLRRRRRRTRSNRGAENRKLALAAEGTHPPAGAVKVLKTFKPAKFDHDEYKF